MIFNLLLMLSDRIQMILVDLPNQIFIYSNSLNTRKEQVVSTRGG